MSEHFGMGWVPDYPDIRDYTGNHKQIKALFEEAKNEYKGGCT